MIWAWLQCISAIGLALAGDAAGAVDDPNSVADINAQVQLSSARQNTLDANNGWPAGSISAQLARDPTLVPYGKGALFVPAMNNGFDEPPVTIWQNGEQVADGTTGTRIVMPPGDYFVQMGSGNVELRFGRNVMVQELSTTVVPVTWAGLTVHVMDAQLNSLRGSYEIIRVADREYMGIGFGTDELAGEPASTWILPPGMYKIVRVGGTYHARTDFATVRLLPGKHTQYMLVQDPVAGTFLGAGEAQPEELFQSRPGFWASFILGGDASLNARKSVVGQPDGTGYTFQVFLDTKLNLAIADNPLLFRLQVSEGQTHLPNLPWQKTQDYAQLDALYIYSMRPWIGPYARIQGLTNLLAGSQYFDPAVDVVTHDNQTGANTGAQNVQSLNLSPAFGSITLKEGVGFNIRALKLIWIETILRGGLGLQQTLNKNVLQDVTPTNSSVHYYDRLGSGQQFGIETTFIIVARLTRWVIANVVVDALFPFDDLKQPNLDIQGSLAVKLTQFVSVNYVLHFTQVPTIYSTNTSEQDILLRFSLELL